MVFAAPPAIEDGCAVLREAVRVAEHLRRTRRVKSFVGNRGEVRHGVPHPERERGELRPNSRLDSSFEATTERR
jgi:hypothetical protein